MKKIMVFVLALIMLTSLQVFSHLDAGEDIVVNGYTLDFGYSPELPKAGEKIVFAINIVNETTDEPASYEKAWIRISDSEQVTFAGNMKPEEKSIAFTYIPPSSGEYHIDIRFMMEKEIIASASFNFSVAKKQFINFPELLGSMDSIAFITSTSSGLSAITLFADILLAALVSGFFLKLFFKKNPFLPLFKFLRRNAMLLAFIIALTATSGSLFYSEIAGFNPCKLCWYQRILMYPHVVLFGLALLKKDVNVWKYALVLSILGAGIAAYHYSLQVAESSVPCSADGVSCGAKYIFDYGYITIPMMALSAFALIIFLVMLKPNKK